MSEKKKKCQNYCTTTNTQPHTVETSGNMNCSSWNRRNRQFSRMALVCELKARSFAKWLKNDNHRVTSKWHQRLFTTWMANDHNDWLMKRNLYLMEIRSPRKHRATGRVGDKVFQRNWQWEPESRKDQEKEAQCWPWRKMSRWEDGGGEKKKIMFEKS